MVGTHGVLVAFGAAMAAALVWGALERPARRHARPAAHHRNLILMVAGRGLAQLLTDGQILTIYEPQSFFWLGGGYPFGLPVSAFVLATVAGLTGS